MITVHSYYGKKIRKGKLSDIRDKRKTTIGIVSQPSKQEIAKLSKMLDITEGNLREFLREKIKPRVEDLEKNSAIIIHEPYASKKGEYRTRPVIIVTSKAKNYAVIIQKTKTDLIQTLRDRYQTRIETMFARGVSFIIYRTIDSTVMDFFSVFEALGDATDKLERKVVRTPDRVSIDQIFHLKKSMIYLHKALIANREVASAIEKERISQLDKKTVKMFREVYEDAVQAIDLGETYREILSGTLEIFLSAQSNKLNETMKTLTIIASFAMIPTLIAGIYGMNFGSPFLADVSPFNMPELRWMYGYPFALGMMFTSVAILTMWLKKKKML